MKNVVIVRGSVTIPKVLLRNDELVTLRRTLEFENAFDLSIIRAYLEDADNVIVPKFYFIKHLLARLRNFIRNEEPFVARKVWEFAGKLRPHQAKPPKGFTSTPDITKLILKYRGVFVSAACGSGKTASAIYTISQLGIPALVITPTESVRKQWLEQVNRFLPTVKVTEYSGKKKDLTGDVVVASMQLVARDPLPRAFPLLIVDESHLVAAPFMQRVMFNVNYRYSLALTATGNRLDGMGELFRWPLAYLDVTMATDQLPVTVLYRPIRHAGSMAYYLKTLEPTQIDHKLALIDTRNTQIMNWLSNAYQAGRKIMVISKSIIQLRILRDVFQKVHPKAKTALYTNEVTRFGKVVKEMKRTAAEKKADEKELRNPEAVVFATVGKAGVGYDDPHKDCLVLALPMQDPRQVIGRVQRRLDGKKPPIVLVPVDNVTSVIGRMRSAFKRTLAPLGDKCILINECPWYRDLKGPHVKQRTEQQATSSSGKAGR